MTDIALGHKVRDRLTKFEGIAIQQIFRAGGNLRWAVQPIPTKPKSGEAPVYPDAIEMDEHLLEYVGVGLSKSAAPVTAVIPFDLGHELEDIASGFKGIAMEKAIYLNGCVYFLLQGKLIKGSLNDTNSWFVSVRLKKVGNGINLPDAAPSPKTGKRPGGPATKVMRPR